MFYFARRAMGALDSGASPFSAVPSPAVTTAVVGADAERPIVPSITRAPVPMPFMTPAQVQQDREALTAALKGEGHEAPAAPAVEAPVAPAPAPAAAPAAPAAASAPVVPETPVQLSWKTVNEAERRVRERMAAFKAEQEAFNKERQAFQKDRDGAGQMPSVTLDKLRQGLQASPIKTLQSLGFSMDDVLRNAIAEHKGQPAQGAAPAFNENAGASNDVAELKKEIASMKQFIVEQNQAQEQQRQLADFRSSLRQEVARPENDLLTAFPGIEDTMLSNAARYASLTEGQVLTSSKVADMMRSELEEHVLSLFAHPAVKKLLAGKMQAQPGTRQAPVTPAAPQQPSKVIAPFQSQQHQAPNPAAQQSSDADIKSLADLAALVTEDVWGA